MGLPGPGGGGGGREVGPVPAVRWALRRPPGVAVAVPGLSAPLSAGAWRWLSGVGVPAWPGGAGLDPFKK